MAKVLFSVPEKFLEKIDKTAEEEQRTRSALIREALRYYMKITNTNTNTNHDILDSL